MSSGGLKAKIDRGAIAGHKVRLNINANLPLLHSVNRSFCNGEDTVQFSCNLIDNKKTVLNFYIYYRGLINKKFLSKSLKT